MKSTGNEPLTNNSSIIIVVQYFLMVRAHLGDRFCDQGFQIERGLVNSYFCLFHLGNHILSTIEEFGFQESPKPRGCRRFINKELIRSF
jgi:hypothetical protein